MENEELKEGLERAQKLLKQSKKRDYYKILGIRRWVCRRCPTSYTAAFLPLHPPPPLCWAQRSRLLAEGTPPPPGSAEVTQLPSHSTGAPLSSAQPFPQCPQLQNLSAEAFQLSAAPGRLCRVSTSAFPRGQSSAGFSSACHAPELAALGMGCFCYGGHGLCLGSLQGQPSALALPGSHTQGKLSIRNKSDQDRFRLL